MKNIKIVYRLILLVFLVTGCAIPDGIDFDISAADSLKEPASVSVLALITQDNTGKVTLIPRGEGATSFEIEYGDGSATTANVMAGGSTVHTYKEGVYKVKITAIGLSGKKTVTEQEIVVSFKAPENLVVTIENDPAVSRKVNITATADYALFYDVYFGDTVDEIPVQANNGEAISHVYASAGTYTIKIVSKSGAIQTTNYEENFVVTEILAPIAVAPTPPFRLGSDVVSIFSDSYTNITTTEWNPGWGQSTLLSNFTIGSDNILKYSLLNYTGIVTDYGNPTNLSAMEFVHFDYWTPNATSLGFKIVNTNEPAGPTKESQVDLSAVVVNEWVSVDIPLSDFTTNKSAITQMLFTSDGSTVFIDNLYFYKNPTPASGLEGTWKLAPEAGALGVGPAKGDKSWWAIDAAGVAARACFFDDAYVFGANGSFSNQLGSDTWLEGWQGTADACGVPVAPHDGSVAASYIYDAGAKTITINGKGAYLGLPKATNAGELPNVSVPNSRVYSVQLSNGNNTMELFIETGAGVWWYFKLYRDTPPVSILKGTWKIAPEAGSLGVGPAKGDKSWWAIDNAGVTARACFFDDTYVFGASDTFSNVLGGSTWLEGWQGTADACGTPVAPHDGSATATFVYDSGSKTITINGKGAYLGLPKATNTGELPNVSVPNSRVYSVELSNSNNTMELFIETGAGVWWYFKLIRI